MDYCSLGAMLEEELPLLGYLLLRGRRPLGAALPPSPPTPRSKAAPAAGKEMKCGSSRRKTAPKAALPGVASPARGCRRRRKRFSENAAVAKRLFQFSSGTLGTKRAWFGFREGEEMGMELLVAFPFPRLRSRCSVHERSAAPRLARPGGSCSSSSPNSQGNAAPDCPNPRKSELGGIPPVQATNGGAGVGG